MFCWPIFLDLDVDSKAFIILTARDVHDPRHQNKSFMIHLRSEVFCKVKHRLGEQIGYVSRDLAEDLAPKMDHEGFVLMAWIMNVAGGEDDEGFGVNIQIEEYRPAKHRATTRLKTRKKAI